MRKRAHLIGGLAVLLLASVTEAQPPGPPGGPPRPGQLLPGFVQEQLRLTAEQRQQVEQLQQKVDERLAKILTAEQKQVFRQGQGPPGGPFGPGGFGPPMGPGGFGPPGGPGPFGAVGRLEDVKKEIEASDEEWKVIGPKLQKVLAARQALAAGARGPDSGFGGPTAGNAISQAQVELRGVLKERKHTAAEVQEKVAAVRQARDRVRGGLEAAQKDLRLLLTADQEAVLVSLGYLD